MPDTSAKPPLEDPLREKEVFASEIAGVGVTHGNITITLAHVRFDEPVGQEAPKMRRIVTGRLVLTNPAAGQLIQHLQRLATQIEAAARAPAPQKPS